MLSEEFEPVARTDRLVAAWQRLILTLLVVVMLGIGVGWIYLVTHLGAPVDPLAPYTITALPAAVA